MPVNHLVPVAETPLAEQKPLDPLEFVRTIAVARITMPKARVCLSAGRQELGRAVQAMCFMAGANSIFTVSNYSLPAIQRLSKIVNSWLNSD